MKKKKSKEEELIISYLNKIKLSPIRSISQFWNELYYKYDKSIVDELGKIVDARADRCIYGDLYEFKNQTLDLSLDFSRYSTDLYRKYFEWFIKIKDRTPSKILDLGCDNGIITCFYALLFPECDVIGIDISENSIKCAEQLKIKLALKNVSFKVAKIQDISLIFKDYNFSFITSVRTLHEAVNLPEAPEHTWSMEDLEKLDQKEFENNDLTKLLTGIKARLASDGQFISWERLSQEENYMYLKYLEKAGLFLNSELSKMIEFHEVGDEQAMAVLVTETEDNHTSLVEEVLRIYTGKEIESLTINDSFEDAAAELCFNECLEKTLLNGFQIDYIKENGNKLRNELWEFDSAILFYQYSNIGFRKLIVYDKDIYSKLLERFGQLKDDSLKAGNIINSYSSLDERDLLQ